MMGNTLARGNPLVVGVTLLPAIGVTSMTGRGLGVTETKGLVEPEPRSAPIRLRAFFKGSKTIRAHNAHLRFLQSLSSVFLFLGSNFCLQCDFLVGEYFSDVVPSWRFYFLHLAAQK